MSEKLRVVMIGATGAVGKATVTTLLTTAGVNHLSLLGRRPLETVTGDPRVSQRKIDIFQPDAYQEYLPGHEVAICTLGVGEPSKMDRDDFIRIDKQAVYDFAVRCRAEGVSHFQLLSSVGTDASSRSFYLRTKGELIRDIQELGFARFSVFQPSMILTPTNRYGFTQGVLLAVWPWLNPILPGSLRKYRGVRVEVLGAAIARNIYSTGRGVEFLTWDEIQDIAHQRTAATP